MDEKTQKAENYLDYLNEKEKGNTKFKALKAEFFLSTNQIQKAKDLYSELKQNYPEDIYISLSYAYYCCI